MKRYRFLDPVGFIIPILLILFWWLYTVADKIPQYILPSPIKLLQTSYDFAFGSLHLTPYSGKLGINLAASLFRVLAGFSAALLFGLPLGFLSGRAGFIKRLIDPLIHAIRTIPGIGWLPLAMFWFGVGERTTLFLISIAAFFPIYINTQNGAASVDMAFIHTGRMLGANRLQILTTVILPAAFPSVITGLRLGLGISWAYLVLGELTGVTNGLGAVMMDARMLGHIELVLVTMVFIAIIGSISDQLLMKLWRLIGRYERGE